MHIPTSTLNRQVKDALASDDGLAFNGGADNPKQPFFQPIEQILEVHSSKKRFVVFDNLDLAKYHPDQIHQMKELLASPLANGGM